MTTKNCESYARRMFAAFPQFGVAEKEWVVNVSTHLAVMATDIRQLNRITEAVTEANLERLPTIAEIRAIAESLPGLELQALINQPVSPDMDCLMCKGNGAKTTWAIWVDGKVRRLVNKFQDTAAVLKCGACLRGFDSIDPMDGDQSLCPMHARGALEIRLARVRSREVVASFAEWCDCDYGRYRSACDQARKRAEQDGGGTRLRRGGL